ncbi:VOC family protein [Nisaea sp.]|uniref:VOC family protein n=1 Tax=Nisaea sp. TaxID=2024842 RepID=UPI003B51FD56
MKPRISMVALAVKDLAVSRDFYENGLGFPRLDSPPTVAFFNLNGTWLGLSEREDLAADAGVPSEGSGYRGFSLAYNVHSPEEVAWTLEEAVAAGGQTVKPPQDAHWGGYHAYFSDPDGHLWEICYNPFAWVGPADEQ